MEINYVLHAELAEAVIYFAKKPNPQTLESAVTLLAKAKSSS